MQTGWSITIHTIKELPYFANSYLFEQLKFIGRSAQQL